MSADYCYAQSYQWRLCFTEKHLHAEVRDEAKELMKLILGKNSEHEGRQVRHSQRFHHSPLIRLDTCESKLNHHSFLPIVAYSDISAQLSVVVEFVAGKITSTIERLIALYRPDSLIVGTRGQTGLVKTWSAAFLAPGMGSVSRYDIETLSKQYGTDGKV
jgi:hypothetical protein